VIVRHGIIGGSAICGVDNRAGSKKSLVNYSVDLLEISVVVEIVKRNKTFIEIHKHILGVDKDDVGALCLVSLVHCSGKSRFILRCGAIYDIQLDLILFLEISVDVLRYGDLSLCRGIIAGDDIEVEFFNLIVGYLVGIIIFEILANYILTTTNESAAYEYDTKH
jgi:hypothetical protein